MSCPSVRIDGRGVEIPAKACATPNMKSNPVVKRLDQMFKRSSVVFVETIPDFACDVHGAKGHYAGGKGLHNGAAGRRASLAPAMVTPLTNRPRRASLPPPIRYKAKPQKYIHY